MIAFLILFLVLPLVIASSNNGWSKKKRADAENEFVFRIDLIIRNVNHLETLFWQISNPDSPSFRKYLSSDEISAIIAPSTNKFGQVIEWLTCSKLLPFSELKQNSTSENNKFKDREIICYQSIYKDFIYVKSTVSTIEKFFNLQLSEYNLQNNDRNLVPTEVTLTRADTVDATLLIPANLHSVISRIYGITELPPLDTLLTSATASGLYRKHRRGHDVATQAREPGDQITPPVIWKTYGLDAVLPLNASLLIGSASCAEFQDEEFLQTDVAKFETLFGLADVKVDIIGANNGGYFGEGSLDTEYLTGTAPGLGVTWIGIPWGSSFTSGSCDTTLHYIRY